MSDKPSAAVAAARRLADNTDKRIREIVREEIASAFEEFAKHGRYKS